MDEINFGPLFENLDRFVAAEEADEREEALANVYDQWIELRKRPLPALLRLVPDSDHTH